MADAYRSVISQYWDKTGENAGLLLGRFLRVSVKDKVNHPTARRDLFNAMCSSLVQSKAIYTAAYERREFAFKDIKSKGLFRTTGRMVIGLGGENVLETGLTLNQTYGTPLIPGTALKGLAAHYCDQAWGAADKKGRFKRGGEYHQAIFGTTEDSGHIVFHDAWITPESLEGSLQSDVVTPHHSKYHSDQTGLTPPTDFDDPIPVQFLSVVGTFRIAVSCDIAGPEGYNWANLVFNLLSDALLEWGIGGKTNAGYGRLSRMDLKEINDPKRRNEPPQIVASDLALNEQNSPILQPIAKNPKYMRGDTLEVTRIADPKVKKARSYFIADDGIGGPVTVGTPPSIEIGKKTRLKVEGVMKEGYYVFAAITPEKNQSQKKGWKGRK